MEQTPIAIKILGTVGFVILLGAVAFCIWAFVYWVKETLQEKDFWGKR